MASTSTAAADIIKLHLEAARRKAREVVKEDGRKVTEEQSGDGAAKGWRTTAKGCERREGGAGAVAAVYINLAPTIHIQVGIHTLSEAARSVE